MARRKTPHRSRPATTRRAFLQMGAATAAGLLARAGVAHASANPEHDVHPDDVPEDARAFFIGVTAGDVSNDTAQIWTRYDGDGRLRLVVWQEEGGRWRQVVHHDTPPGTRGAVQVPVDGLAAHTEHRYVFYVVGDDGRPRARSRVGRFRTAPREDALVPVTVGAVACIRNGYSQRVLEAVGQRRDLDLLVQLGDSVYADGSRTIAEYRKCWWENLSKPGYQALRASTSVLATWDDHEVDNDWFPGKVSDAKVVAAREAFFEHMPMCREDSCRDRIWRSRRWGRTLEIFVLDCRGERHAHGKDRRYISPEQMAWLQEGLAKSPAMFKLVVNTVPITQFPPLFSTTKNDRWENYPEQRREILSFIESRQIPGVLWVAGDFHLATIGRASAHGVGSHTMELLAGPGAQIANPLVPFLWGRQFDWASGRNNVTALHFDPLLGRVGIEYLGDDGRAFHQAVYRRRSTRGFDRVEDWLL